MKHKNVVCQTEIKNGGAAFAVLCYIIAILSVVASFIVAGICKSYRYGMIEWMFRYIEAYMWFYVGAAVFAVIGSILRKAKPGVLTVTDLYVSLEYPDGLSILPIWNITSIRKVTQSNTIIISTSNFTIQVGNVVICDEVIAAVLEQMEKTVQSEE